MKKIPKWLLCIAGVIIAVAVCTFIASIDIGELSTLGKIGGVIVSIGIWAFLINYWMLSIDASKRKDFEGNNYILSYHKDGCGICGSSYIGMKISELMSEYDIDYYFLQSSVIEPAISAALEEYCEKLRSEK